MYILVSYCAPISLRSVFGANAHGDARSEPSLWSLAENHARLTAKWKYFNFFLTFTDGDYTCEM